MTNERHEKALEAADVARARLFITTQSKDGVPERLMDIVRIRNECMEEGIRAYLRAMDAVIVPKEPSEEMVGAGLRRFYTFGKPSNGICNAYRVMIQIAPNQFTNGE